MKISVLLKWVASLLVLASLLLAGAHEARRQIISPLGALQRKQVSDVAAYLGAAPAHVQFICFTTSDEHFGASMASIADSPGMWWYVGFGAAFELFADGKRQYRIAAFRRPWEAKTCDVVLRLTPMGAMPAPRTP